MCGFNDSEYISIKIVSSISSGVLIFSPEFRLVSFGCGDTDLLVSLLHVFFVTVGIVAKGDGDFDWRNLD